MLSTPNNNPLVHPFTGHANTEQQKTSSILHTTPQQASEKINTGSLPSAEFSISKSKLLLRLTAILATLLWVSRNVPIPYRQWKLEAIPASSTSPPPTVLEVFQVHPPVLIGPESAPETLQEPSDHDHGSITSSTKDCHVLLMNHSFGFSYGKPFVGMQPWSYFREH